MRAVRFKSVYEALESYCWTIRCVEHGWEVCEHAAYRVPKLPVSSRLRKKERDWLRSDIGADGGLGHAPRKTVKCMYLALCKALLRLGAFGQPARSNRKFRPAMLVSVSFSHHHDFSPRHPIPTHSFLSLESGLSTSHTQRWRKVQDLASSRRTTSASRRMFLGPWSLHAPSDSLQSS